MRASPNLRIQKYRQPDPQSGRIDSAHVNAWYRIPCRGVQLVVIASDGLGWDHVSVSLKHRCPTWDEMCFVRDLFFRDDETVMQIHVPPSDSVNVHQFCLHLWRPQILEIPRPPRIMVG